MMTKTKAIIAASVLVFAASAVGQMWTYFENVYPRLTRSELKDGKLILEFRRETPRNIIVAVNCAGGGPLASNEVEIWRDVYAVSNGVIVLEKTQKAHYSPPVTTTEPEKIGWPE